MMFSKIIYRIGVSARVKRTRIVFSKGFPGHRYFGGLPPGLQMGQFHPPPSPLQGHLALVSRCDALSAPVSWRGLIYNILASHVISSPLSEWKNRFKR